MFVDVAIPALRIKDSFRHSLKAQFNQAMIKLLPSTSSASLEHPCQAPAPETQMHGHLSACDPTELTLRLSVLPYVIALSPPSFLLSASLLILSRSFPAFVILQDKSFQMNPATSAADQQIHRGDISDRESKAGILPSHGISLDVPGFDAAEGGRPALIQHMYVHVFARQVNSRV